jgi:hypothetical protein
MYVKQAIRFAVLAHTGLRPAPVPDTGNLHDDVVALLRSAAVERKEIPEFPPQRIADLPFGLFRHEILMNLAPASEATLEDIVDTVLMPLVTATRRAPACRNSGR